MNPSDHRWRGRVGTFLGIALILSGCARKSSEPQPPPQDRSRIVEAEFSPLPEFHRYVVGALEAPDVGLRDPFREGKRIEESSAVPSHRGSKPGPTRFSLLGIVERDGHRTALFRRGSVRVGESLAGWRVIEIAERKVILERNGRTRRLSL